MWYVDWLKALPAGVPVLHDLQVLEAEHLLVEGFICNLQLENVSNRMATASAKVKTRDSSSNADPSGVWTYTL
jgi:hypothetical protein